MSSLAKISVAALFLVITALPQAAAAEESTGKPLELARIFGPKATALERPGAIRWLPGGASYSKFEKAADATNSLDVVRYDVASGKRVRNHRALDGRRLGEPALLERVEDGAVVDQRRKPDR